MHGAIGEVFCTTIFLKQLSLFTEKAVQK